jgi:hypothetical protein
MGNGLLRKRTASSGLKGRMSNLPKKKGWVNDYSDAYLCYLSAANIGMKHGGIHM